MRKKDVKKEDEKSEMRKGPWIITLSEVSQTEKDKYRMISLTCGN